ncbi:cob(I)yrinic acid a,c-diamide adenosyltransferase [Patescibacteria group bacterium]|nr:cob(I)yrinic acid a,c-diamide adenosyltransferase [Patescibacteria group bacterium]MBU1683383.1 cob(I)yrinic acid a,c-diamide adenosyltransferase [Patescibacteria group bacterium]MBU1935468.1 cob(I)yrinic acid a,c-diamide adenosyltransferase [Patescibacteria group bacterium]
MILVITGDGKGKTTSSLGTAIRAAGWNKAVSIVFFDKGGEHYGEQNILDQLKDKIDVFRFGHDRFNEKTQEFRFANTRSDENEAKKGIEKIYTLYNKKFKIQNSKFKNSTKGYFLIVADEILTCIKTGLLSDSAVHDLVDKCPKNVHLVLTGRSAPDWLIKKADLVSDVNEVKHYSTREGRAIKGLDF